jgi:hypothetical protein
VFLTQLGGLAGGEFDFEQTTEATGGAGLVVAAGVADAKGFGAGGGNHGAEGRVEGRLEVGIGGGCPAGWRIETSEGGTAGAGEGEMEAAAVVGVRHFAEEALRFEQIEALGHVALAQAKEFTNGEWIVGKGIGAGEIPEGEDVNGFEAFGGGSGAEFAAKESGEAFEQEEGAVGGHLLNGIAAILS